MVIHMYLLFYTFTTCELSYILKYYSKPCKDLPGVSSLASEYMVSPSTDSESAWPSVSSNVLLSVLSLGLCHCLCSILLLLVSLALVFHSLTHVQLGRSFLDLLGVRSPSHVCTLSFGATIARFLSAFGS